MKKYAVTFIFIIGVIIIVWYVANRNSRPPESVNSFADCVAAGNPVMESYPRQCRHGDQTFMEEIGNELDKTDLVRIFEPRPGSVISSPLTVKGEARGTWFFEASFPVRLLDGNGNEIAVSPAQAQGEWMTEKLVPFSSVLTFSLPSTREGTLILEKDNPSGLPEHADELRVPVQFAPPPSLETGGCMVTGCSGQVCAEKELITTCEYRPEYACFKTATCERQPNGRCGWTPTAELKTCLEKNGVAVESVRSLY